MENLRSIDQVEKHRGVIWLFSYSAQRDYLTEMVGWTPRRSIPRCHARTTTLTHPEESVLTVHVIQALIMRISNMDD